MSKGMGPHIPLASLAAVSGGEAVKDGGRGGVSPNLHKRSAEGWGYRVRSRAQPRASLTAWGVRPPGSPRFSGAGKRNRAEL